MSAIREDKPKPPNQKDIQPKQATAKEEIGHTSSVDGNAEIPYDGQLLDFVTVTLPPPPAICAMPIDDIFLKTRPVEIPNVVPTAGNQQEAVAGPKTNPGGGRE